MVKLNKIQYDYIITNCKNNYELIYDNSNDYYYDCFDITEYIDFLADTQIVEYDDDTLYQLFNDMNAEKSTLFKHHFNKQRFALSSSHKYNDYMYNNDCYMVSFNNDDLHFTGAGKFVDNNTIKCIQSFVYENQYIHICNVFVDLFTVPVYKLIILDTHVYGTLYDYQVYSKCIDVDSMSAIHGYTIKKRTELRKQIDVLEYKSDQYIVSLNGKYTDK